MKTAIAESFRDEDVQKSTRIMGGVALLVIWLSVAFNAGGSWNFWIISVLAFGLWAICAKRKTQALVLVAIALTVLAIGVGMLETMGL